MVIDQIQEYKTTLKATWIQINFGPAPKMSSEWQIFKTHRKVPIVFSWEIWCFFFLFFFLWELGSGNFPIWYVRSFPIMIFGNVKILCLIYSFKKWFSKMKHIWKSNILTKLFFSIPMRSGNEIFSCNKNIFF